MRGYASNSHLSFQSVEGIILLPQGKDFPKLDVDGSEPHFLTVGAKGEKSVFKLHVLSVDFFF